MHSCLSTLVWNSMHSVSEHTGVELNALVSEHTGVELNALVFITLASKTNKLVLIKCPPPGV